MWSEFQRTLQSPVPCIQLDLREAKRHRAGRNLTRILCGHRLCKGHLLLFSGPPLTPYSLVPLFIMVLKFLIRGDDAWAHITKTTDVWINDIHDIICYILASATWVCFSFFSCQGNKNHKQSRAVLLNTALRVSSVGSWERAWWLEWATVVLLDVSSTYLTAELLSFLCIVRKTRHNRRADFTVVCLVQCSTEKQTSLWTPAQPPTLKHHVVSCQVLGNIFLSLGVLIC